MSEQQPDTFAGTGELVDILAAITTARMQFPDNPRIQALHESANKLIDSDLTSALLMQLSRAKQEAAQSRTSPMAQLLQSQTKR